MNDEEGPVIRHRDIPHRDFRLLQVARFASIVGIQMQSVAVGWHVFSLTHRPIDLGWVGLAQFLPAIALTLVTGHAADRFDRRRLLAGCYAAISACTLLLFALALLGIERLAPLYAVLVLLGAARAFTGPAGRSLLPAVVPAEDLPGAIAWSSSVWQVATIAGPAIGGAMCGWTGGATAVYGASAGLTAVAVAVLLAMRLRPVRREPEAASWRSLLAGVRYVWGDKIVLGALSMDLFAVLLGGAVALMPIYAQDILHVGPHGLGFLRSAPAVGAALSAVALARRPIHRRAGVTLSAVVAIFGLATVAFGVSRSFALSLALLVLMGAVDMVSVVIRQTLLQLRTPDAMRGRVNAVDMAFIGASNELGEFESGLTASWLGTVPAVVVGGVGTCLVAVLWAFVFPSLRRIDALDDKPPAAS